MRILLLTAYYYPRIGGVEYVVRETVKELKRRGHEITIVTRKHDPDLSDEEIIDDVLVKRIPYPRGWRNMWKTWIWLLRNREAITSADLVDCENISPFYWYLPFIFLYPLKPVYAVYYGYEYPVKPFMVFLRRLSEILVNDHICGGTYLKKYYGTSCERVIYPIVDMKVFKPGKKDNHKICFVGRLHEDTNVMGYLEAMKILKLRYDIMPHLDVCGDGSQRKELEEFAKKNMLDVTFHGFIKDPQNYYKGAAFAFSSTAGVTLEGMASKCLVFHLYSNDVVKDLIESLEQKRGIVTIAYNPEELAKKLYSFYTNKKETERKIAEGYEFAKNFSAKNIADIFIGMYTGEKPLGLKPFK